MRRCERIQCANAGGGDLAIIPTAPCSWRGGWTESLAKHRALMKALHARDADAAKDMMHNHLLAQLVALREMATKAVLQNG